jgi:hypothetical protein
MTMIRLSALAGIAALLAACAQPEPPVRINPQPMFDKFGGGACEDGYIYVPGAVPEQALCIPEDECEPTYDANGSLIPCPPPNRYPNPNDGGDDGRSPNTPGARG